MVGDHMTGDEADLPPAIPQRRLRGGRRGMSNELGPTVRRRRLGQELRDLRELAGLDQAAAAARLECSTSKISRLEKGQGLAKAIEVKGLLDLYNVTDQEARDKILQIHRQAGQTGWWEQAQYEEVLPSGLGVYVGLENDARALRTWELAYVPGLLQTEDYARAVLASTGQRSAKDVERLLSVRLQRQQRLTAAANPLELWAVLDEVVLLRQVGGPTVMTAQIEHLRTAAQQQNITLQIYPLGKDAHPGMRGAFSLLEFGPTDPLVGYVDSHAGNLYLERDRQTRTLGHAFDRLRAGALDPEDSAVLLAKHAAKEK